MIEICIAYFLAWLPEANFGKVAQVPRKRPGIGSNHRNAWRGYSIPASQVRDFSGKSENVFRSVGIGVWITLVRGIKKDALARVVSDQDTSQGRENAECWNRCAQTESRCAPPPERLDRARGE